MRSAGRWPAQLLQEAAWDFEGQGTFSTLTAFIAAVRAYECETFVDAPPDWEPWNPEAIALDAPRVLLRYYADPADRASAWQDAILESPNGQRFTAGELLFAVHNAVVPALSSGGHHWFEGLGFDGENREGIPIYVLIGGS